MNLFAPHAGARIETVAHLLSCQVDSIASRVDARIETTTPSKMEASTLIAPHIGARTEKKRFFGASFLILFKTFSVSHLNTCYNRHRINPFRKKVYICLYYLRKRKKADRKNHHHQNTLKIKKQKKFKTRSRT